MLNLILPLFQQQDCLGAELPVIKTFDQLKTFGTSSNEKYDKDDRGLLSSWNPV